MKKEPTYKSLKLIGGQTITLPTRERFNEEVESVIHEQNKDKKIQNLGLVKKNMQAFEKDRFSEITKSNVSRISKKTLTATELKEYFK